jgi:hypothetical protein
LLGRSRLLGHKWQRRAKQNFRSPIASAYGNPFAHPHICFTFAHPHIIHHFRILSPKNSETYETNFGFIPGRFYYRAGTNYKEKANSFG